MNQRIELLAGVFLRAVQTDKFKTGCLSISFLRPLCRELRYCQQTAERLPQMQLIRQSREGSDITKGKEVKQHGSER